MNRKTASHKDKAAPAKTAHWPLILALAVYLVGVTILIFASVTRCDGKVSYALDDAYIHLALADTFGKTGTWGFHDGVFSSASSSPLWTMILTIILPLWHSEILVLVLNILSGVGLILLLSSIAKRRGMDAKPAAMMMISTVIFTSTIALTMLGMEHLLHTFLFVLLLDRGAKALDEDRAYIFPLILAALVGSIRYEGLFAVIALFLMMAWRRKWWWAIGMLVAGFIPVIIVGYASHLHGWPVVPSSLMTKTGIQHYNTLRGLAKLLVNFIYQTLTTPMIWPAFIIGSIPVVWHITNRKFNGYTFYISSLFILSFFAHMHTAGVGWMHRYEAYLYAGAIFVFFVGGGLQAINGVGPKLRKVFIAFLAFGILFAIVRSVDNYHDLYKSQPNIYMQQYQTGRFMHEYYDNSIVVINDIGAPAWLSNIQLIDPAGLASKEFISVSWKDTVAYISEMERVADSLDAQVAVLYRNFVNVLDWEYCGSYVIPNNHVCASDSVIFLAIDPEAAPALRRNVADFANKLPAGVRVHH